MVVRRRLRKFLIPLALYAVSGPVSAYFVWHAVNGERGLKQREAYQAQMQALIATASELAQEKRRLEHRIKLLRAKAVERDLLDEQARNVLGRVAANEVVVMLPDSR